LIDGTIFEHSDRSDLSSLAVIDVLLAVPVKWLQLFNNFKHNLVVIALLENF